LPLLVQDVLEPVPLFISLDTAASSACALAAFSSKPFPSPPVAAWLRVGFRNSSVPPPPAVVTVRPAERVLLPLVAVTVTSVVLVTAIVVTVNVAVVAPAGTVTPGGVDAAVESADSDTARPPLGAGALSVTVPVAEAPPVTLEGLSVSDVNVTVGGGVTPGSTHRTG
jgi:hypothetical protein